MNKNEAIKATRNGAIAASISAAVTLIIVLIAISADAEGRLAIWNDPLNLIDVLMILGCAVGMYRKSRVASVLIFFYFIVAKIIIAVETKSMGGIMISLVFLYFYAKAIQGSFVFHRLEKAENPNYKATTKWAYVLGIPSVLIIVASLTFALMSVTGFVPSTRVQTGDEMKANETSALIESGIIAPDENIEFFYSQGLSSILESGNVLTDDRVILYLTDENNELQIYEIPIAQISDVILEYQGDAINDSIYKVTSSDPERWLKLFLSIEQKGDKKFVSAIRAKMPK